MCTFRHVDTSLSDRTSGFESGKCGVGNEGYNDGNSSSNIPLVPSLASYLSSLSRAYMQLFLMSTINRAPKPDTVLHLSLLLHSCDRPMEAPSVEYSCDEHGRLSPRTEQHRGGPHLCSMDEGNARGSTRRCTRMLDLSTWQKERRGSGRNQCLTDCRYFFLFFLRSCWGLLGGWTSRVCKVELAAAPATHHPVYTLSLLCSIHVTLSTRSFFT